MEKILRIEEQIKTQEKKYDYIIHELMVKDLGKKLRFSNLYSKKRGFSWNKDKQSIFIESLLIGIPMTAIFLKETESEVMEIVYGLPHLSAISLFTQDRLPLQALSRLTELNGAVFSQLKESRQRKFFNKSIRTVVFSERLN